MMTMMNPHPQQSNSNNEEDTPSQLGLLHLCCPIEYAHAASNIKPLPTSTTPLAGEEQVSSTRSKSKGSIGLCRDSSRAASTNEGDGDGEQPIIDEQRSTSTSAKPDDGDGSVSASFAFVQRLTSTISTSTSNVDEDEDEEQPNIDEQGSTSSKQEREEGDIDIALIPFGQDEDEEQEPQPRACRWKKGAKIASVCAFCTGTALIALAIAMFTATRIDYYRNQGYLAKCPKSAASSTAVNNTAANCTIAKSPKSTANSTVAKSSKSAAISAKSPKSAAISTVAVEDELILPPAQYLITPGPDPVPSSPLHRLLSWLGLMSSSAALDEGEVEQLIGVEEVAFELEDESVITKCDPGTWRYFDDTWHIYDGFIEKNRKIALMARSVKEYAPKRGLVEDITEQQNDGDVGVKDVSIKDVDRHFIPHHLIFTHKNNLLDCEVSSSEPSLHTMAHNVRDTIEAYRQVWGDDMEYNFLTDVDCRKAIHEAEPELLAFYDDLEGMFKGDICRSAILFLSGGYYFDVDLLVVHPFVASPANKFVTVKWAWYEQDHQFFQAFIAAAPRNKIVKNSLTIMLELLKGTRAKRGGGAMHMLGTQAMQDAWAEAVQEDPSISSQGKNEEVYLLSEHRLADNNLLPEGRRYSKLPYVTKDIGYTEGTCNYFVADDDEESVYFFSHILGAEHCGKPLTSFSWR